MIRITTHDGPAMLEHLVNPKYIVRVDELSDGTSEMLLESGDRYIVSKSIYAIEELIQADKE